jgi:hypothetical protein
MCANPTFVSQVDFSIKAPHQYQFVVLSSTKTFYHSKGAGAIVEQIFYHELTHAHCTCYAREPFVCQFRPETRQGGRMNNQTLKIALVFLFAAALGFIISYLIASIFL